MLAINFPFPNPNPIQTWHSLTQAILLMHRFFRESKSAEAINQLAPKASGDNIKAVGNITEKSYKPS